MTRCYSFELNTVLELKLVNMAAFCGSYATISLLSNFQDGNTNETKEKVRYMKTSVALQI